RMHLVEVLRMIKRLCGYAELSAVALRRQASCSCSGRSGPIRETRIESRQRCNSPWHDCGNRDTRANTEVLSSINLFAARLTVAANTGHIAPEKTEKTGSDHGRELARPD